MTLTIRRASERCAWLLGPGAIIDAIAHAAKAADLTSRAATDDRLRVIAHPSEAVLVAACVALGYDVRPTCALCEAGVCSVHRHTPSTATGAP